MKDLKQELVEALQLRNTIYVGVKVYFDECGERTVDTQNLDDEMFMVSHVDRLFETMQFDGLVKHFEQEVINDIMALQQQGVYVEKMAVLFKEVPSIKAKNLIRYVKVIRKKTQ